MSKPDEYESFSAGLFGNWVRSFGKQGMSQEGRDVCLVRLKRELRHIGNSDHKILLDLWENTKEPEIKNLIETQLAEVSKTAVAFSALINCWKRTEEPEIKTLIITLVSEVILESIDNHLLLFDFWREVEADEIRVLITARIEKISEVITNFLMRIKNEASIVI